MSSMARLSIAKPRSEKAERFEARVLTLRGAACNTFVNALLNPPRPNAAARAAAKRYKNAMIK